MFPVAPQLYGVLLKVIKFDEPVAVLVTETPLSTGAPFGDATKISFVFPHAG
jgi:hypothetical protein